MQLLVGERLIGDPVPRDSAGIQRFLAVQDRRETTVPGREGGDPAGVLRIERPGLTIVGYESRPHALELSRETFEKYLGEEGLDAVKAFAGAATSRRTARERFSRCAKALLSAGVASGEGADRALGMRLELVAGRNPYAASPGAELPFALLYEGKPLPGALVIAINRDDPSSKLAARSDANGRVTFRLPRSGMWLIKTVHMIAAPAGSGADWESFWASLTFELPAPAPANGVRSR